MQSGIGTFVDTGRSTGHMCLLSGAWYSTQPALTRLLSRHVTLNPTNCPMGVIQGERINERIIPSRAKDLHGETNRVVVMNPECSL